MVSVSQKDTCVYEKGVRLLLEDSGTLSLNQVPGCSSRMYTRTIFTT